MIIAWRMHLATSSPFWLKARCSNSTMPRSGFDFDSRTEITSVSTRIVSPWKTGCGKTVSFMPRLATVVPSVVSCTEMPIISPSVNSELTSGLPHSVLDGEVEVDMQRLRVQRHHREHHVVALGDRLAQPWRNTWPGRNSSR